MASRQQSEGIDHVTQAIAQMERVTQSTAATAEESAAASQELNSQAEESTRVVTQLEQLVGGASHQAAPAGGHARPERVAGSRGKVVSLASVQAPPKGQRPVPAEEVIPLADTGTFGSF